MRLAYLGFFERVLSYVLDKILSPIFNWLVDLLTSIISWLCNTILEPLLIHVLLPLVQTVIDLLLKTFSSIFYFIMSSLWMIIDAIEVAFDIFIGLKPVVDTYTGAEGSLLEMLYSLDTIRYSFYLIMILGIGMALLFSIYAVTKSMFDLDFDNQKPVSKVIASTLKAAVQFMMVPLLVLFLIRFSAVLVSSIDTSMQIGMSGYSEEVDNNSSLGSTLFMMSSLNAAKSDGFNSNSASPDVRIGTVNDPVRGPFYRRDVDYDYADIDKVDDFFDLGEMDYLTGLLTTVFLLFILVSCSLVFIQRIFDMLLLYIVSPLFVSMYPLDDGERFKKWRDLFIGKCFSGFGTIISMRLYLIVVPAVMTNQISFTGATGSIEMAFLMKILVLLGGAYALLKSGPMITKLISSSVGQQEASTSDMTQHLMFDTIRDRFTGNKKGGKGGEGGEGKDGEGKDGEGGEGKGGEGGEGGKGGDAVGERPGGGKIKGLEGDKKNKAADKAAQAAQSNQKTRKILGMTFKTNRDGKWRPEIKMGSLFTNSYGADGSHKVKLLGMNLRWDKDGNMNRARFLGIGAGWHKSKDENGNETMKRGFEMNWGALYTNKTHKDGSRSSSILGVSRHWNAAGNLTDSGGFGVRFRRNTETGEMYMSSNRWIGLNRVQDDDGSVHTTSRFGLHYSKNEDGKYRFSGGYGLFVDREMNEQGKVENVGVGLNMFGHKRYLYNNVSSRLANEEWRSRNNQKGDDKK